MLVLKWIADENFEEPSINRLIRRGNGVHKVYHEDELQKAIESGLFEE